MGEIKMRIETTYFRICIHRRALKEINDPTFLNFGYDPETTRLMVMGSWVDDRKSIRVRYNNSGSVYVFSKPLLTAIRKVSNVLTADGSYLVNGEVHAAKKMIIFPLCDAAVLSEKVQSADTE